MVQGHCSYFRPPLVHPYDKYLCGNLYSPLKFLVRKANRRTAGKTRPINDGKRLVLVLPSASKSR